MPQQEGLGVDCKPLNNPYFTETGDDDNKGVWPTQMSNMAPQFSWLERMPVYQEVEGQNPSGVASSIKQPLRGEDRNIH